jgi:biopolymer transport protein ExbD
VSKKKAVKTEEEVQCNLIPMIDIMFLLLLFFMLGADMGQRELEEVTLPTASTVKEDKDPPKDRITVNVYHRYAQEGCKCDVYAKGDVCVDESHWTIGVRGHDYTKETIKGFLQEAADEDRPEGKGKPSGRQVLIRADQCALYGYVQKVMNAAAEVGIYKIQIGAAQVVTDH